MSALTAALADAFPELHTSPALALPRARAAFLPWPEAGWKTAAPHAAGSAARALQGTQCTLKRIQDIQAGKAVAAVQAESVAGMAGVRPSHVDFICFF